MNVAEVFAEGFERFGERTQLIYEGREYGSGELRDRAGRLVGALRALGAGEGDRVAVMLPNCPDVPVAYDAVARMGAVCLPMLFLLAPPEIGLICGDADPKVLLTSPEFVANVEKGIADLADPPVVLVVGEPGYEQRLAAATPDERVVQRSADDLAVVAFTSGTTSRPKGVMLTHGNLLSEVELSTSILGHHSQDVSLGVLPMAHLFGLAGTLTSQRHGYLSILHRWFTPEGFLRDIERYRVTVTGAVPTMLTLVLNHPRFEATDFSSLRTLVVGAAPLPLELAAEWEQRTGSTILQGYGMTETSAGAVLDRPDRPKRAGSCGLAFPRTEVVAMDDEGRILPPGETGEICIRGPQITPGYWRDPEATAATIVDGWLHSGDMGHLDEDGYVYITDRRKDLIIRGGLNVYPRDVEEVLYAHPAVAEAAVVGRPDPALGEAVIACVVLRPGAEAQPGELLAWCGERLARYKLPAEVRLLDALPKTPIGKILKRDLRALVAEPV